MMLIAPTSFIFCNCGFTFSSANFIKCWTVSPLAVRKTFTTEAPPMSNLLTSGIFASRGSTTAETLSLTSFVASLMSRSKKNLTITTLAPSLLVEVILSTPPIRDIASSILSVT